MDNPFVSTDWLAARLGDPTLVIIDGSWFLPAANRRPREEYLAGHIPGAVFFDIDEVADKSTGLPHMLLAPEPFAKAVGALGIGDGMTIVIYDEDGLFSAPRVWWEFSAMGAVDIRILEGGGPKWRAEGRPLESDVPLRRPARFTPRFRPELVRSFEQVEKALAERQTVVDARPPGRFAGRDPEPRPGVVSGHMPGSVNIPALELAEGGKLKPIADLRTMFDRVGIDLSQPITATCGSGVTASTLTLALRLAGAKDVAVYDGAWAEWGSRPGAPIDRD